MLSGVSAIYLAFICLAVGVLLDFFTMDAGMIPSPWLRRSLRLLGWLALLAAVSLWAYSAWLLVQDVLAVDSANLP